MRAQQSRSARAKTAPEQLVRRLSLILAEYATRTRPLPHSSGTTENAAYRYCRQRRPHVYKEHTGTHGVALAAVRHATPCSCHGNGGEELQP